MKRKGICFALCFILAMSFIAIPTHAASNVSSEDTRTANRPLRYTYISSIAASLELNSAGKASCYGNVMLNNASTPATLAVSLEKKTGNTWDSIKSWSTSSNNRQIFSLDNDWYVVSGYDYRVCVTVTVYNSNGAQVEKASIYSKTVNY